MSTRIEKQIMVNVPVSVAYNQWTQFEEFPHFMSGVKQVEQLSDDRLHWNLRAHCYVRRTKKQVLPQLPAKRHDTVPVLLSNEQEYRLAENDVIAVQANAAILSVGYFVIPAARGPRVNGTVISFRPSHAIMPRKNRLRSGICRQASTTLRSRSLKSEAPRTLSVYLPPFWN